MSERLLSFTEITFGYDRKKTPVLAGLDVSLAAGHTTAILGPNGAGKTTLLHLALGWLRPWQGDIRLAGKPIGAYPRRELGCWMALVPQGEHIPFEYSVLEYVLLGRAPHLPPLAMPAEKDYAAALGKLERVQELVEAHPELADLYAATGGPDSECLYLFPLKKTEPLGEVVPSGPLTIIYR